MRTTRVAVKDHCVSCYAKNPKHECPRCRNRWFCSERCQRKDWELGHKGDCGLNAFSLPEVIPRPLLEGKQIVADAQWESLACAEPLSVPPLGLDNLGNTCFANAVLQCFLRLPALTSYFSNGILLKQSSGERRPSAGDNEPSKTSSSSFCPPPRRMDPSRTFTAELQGLSQKMSSARSELQADTRVRLVGLQREELNGQLGIIEAYHEDRKRWEVRIPGHKSPLAVRDENLVAQGSVAPKDVIRWLPHLFEDSLLQSGAQHDAEEFLKGAVETLDKEAQRATPNGNLETSLMGRVFQGVTVNAMTCPSCLHTTQKQEVFRSLSLELVEATDTVLEMLQLFTAPERLDKNNRFKCEKCEKEVRARKQLLIAEAPHCLLLTLKRFRVGTYGKVNKHVDFSEELNLLPFVCRGKGNTQDIPEYTLIGIVVHLDKLNISSYGHYVSYVKVANQWYLCDDEDVKPVSKEDVFKQNAYLLFYRRTENAAKQQLEYQSKMRTLRPAAQKVEQVEPQLCRAEGCTFYGNHDGFCSCCYKKEYGCPPPPPPKEEPKAEEPKAAENVSEQENKAPAASKAKVKKESASTPAVCPPAAPGKKDKKVGVNDPCPCGSGKKYKKCHGK